MIFHLFRLDLENENFESIPKIVSERVELCFGKRKKKWLLVQPLPPLFSPQHQKTFSSTNPISQTLTIPKSFNGLCKPFKSQPSRSISLTSCSHSRCNSSFVVKTSMSICHFYPISCTFSLSNKLSLLVQALWSSWFKPLPPHLTTETPNHRLNMDDATDGRKTRSFIFSIQALDVWFVVSLTHHLYLSL